MFAITCPALLFCPGPFRNAALFTLIKQPCLFLMFCISGLLWRMKVPGGYWPALLIPLCLMRKSNHLKSVSWLSMTPVSGGGPLTLSFSDTRSHAAQSCHYRATMCSLKAHHQPRCSSPSGVRVCVGIVGRFTSLSDVLQCALFEGCKAWQMFQ